MRKTKLLLVTDEMEVGGSQRQIVEIATGLDRSRFAPELLYFRNHSFLVDKLGQSGVPVHFIAKRRKLDIAFLLKLRKFLKAQRYDIVHGFSFTGELWTALAMKLTGGGCFIGSIRGVYEWNSPIQWRLKRWITGQAATTIANSQAGADYAAARMRWPRERIEVVHNGIDPLQADHAVARERCDREFGLAPGVPLIVFVGRLVVDKNLPLLIDVAGRLHDKGIAFNLILAGDGPLRADIERMVANRGLSASVHFAGQRSDARALIGAGDVFVLCSFREGLSNVILEAMAEGRPVVASAVGGNIELIEDGVTGLLFPDGAADAMTERLVGLIDDPRLRHAIGEAARRRFLERFTTERMIESIQTSYTRCVGAGQ